MKTASLEDLVKIKIPITEEPPEVRFNWRERVHPIPSITQALQEQQKGLFIIIFDTRCQPHNGESNRKNMFATADVQYSFPLTALRTHVIGITLGLHCKTTDWWGKKESRLDCPL